MRFGAIDLISKGTQASGRSLIALCGAVLLVRFLKIDVSGFSLLGISVSETQLNIGSLWVVAVLWVALLVNWLADLASLGRWNNSMTNTLAESTYGGGGKIKGRLIFIAENLEQAFEESAKSGKPLDEGTVRYIQRSLTELDSSYWWYNKTAFFYVVVWAFAVPTILSLVAAFSLLLG